MNNSVTSKIPGESLDEAPSTKRIKSDTNFPQLINEMYDLKFNVMDRTKEQDEALLNGLQNIRETLEATNSSSEISFGTTRVLAKVNWGRCLSLLLDDDTASLKGLNILGGKLNPGGGLL